MLKKRLIIQTFQKQYVKATIWQHEGTSGPFLDVSFQNTRNSKTKGSAKSFGIGELSTLAELALQADKFIREFHNIDL